MAIDEMLESLTSAGHFLKKNYPVKSWISLPMNLRTKEYKWKHDIKQYFLQLYRGCPIFN